MYTFGNNWITVDYTEVGSLVTEFDLCYLQVPLPNIWSGNTKSCIMGNPMFIDG